MSKEMNQITEALEDISITFDELGYSPTVPIFKGHQDFNYLFKTQIGIIKTFSKKQDDKIADLKAKLDEKTRVAEGYSELFDKKQHENYKQFCEIQELKQQLIDECKEHQEFCKVADDKVKELKQQLAEKDEYIKKWKLDCEECNEKHRQKVLELDREQLRLRDYARTLELSQSALAVIELEKVKELIYANEVDFKEIKNLPIALNNYEIGFDKGRFKAINIIDQQIELLKGETNGSTN